MMIYPFQAPILMNDSVFLRFGGGLYTGSFSSQQLQDAYLIAETQVTEYIGTPLLPIIVTGTYNYESQPRIATDYGYVSNILSVNILSQNYFSANCDLISNPGCAFISSDTFGYIDVQQLLPTATLVSYYSIPYPAFPPSSPFLANFLVPYQFQIAYQCGLPTGTASHPSVLRALAILSQIYLDDLQPGLAGMNEGNADVAIQEFKSIDYTEMRAKTALRRTNLGQSPKANRAAFLIDSCIKKARRAVIL
jgi:hypothetical protein